MSILMVDNFDSFTYNLVQLLTEAGKMVVTYRNDAGLEVIERETPELIVISPGPSSPGEAGMSMEVIRKYAGQIPIFGVCLGMQAMAEVFGTRIKPLSIDEIVHGEATKITHDGMTIFAGLPQLFKATRYHSLGAYPEEVTGDLEVSATTTAPNGRNIVMGLRHKKYLVEGVQFHPESVLTMRDGVGEKLVRNAVNYLAGSKL
ncbi:MAG: aminodeoxychorismate/anthranilate synthase component II [Nanoarchaeota archaeon]